MVLSDGIPFAPWQWGVLALAWAVACLLPALWVRRDAIRRGREWRRWFWLTLVASVLGVVEYRKFHAIEARRAARQRER